MDKMFDSAFRYGVLSFPHTDTSNQVVVFRVRLDSSAGLFDSSFYEFDSSLTTSARRRLPFCRFGIAFHRVSTRPLRRRVT